VFVCLLFCLSVSLLNGVPIGAQAASPVDVYEFADSEQKQRYKALIAEFRCPKCLNINIAGSDAPIAQDLRRTVHRLVVQEAMSDQQVRDYLQARYGDFVLYDPPFNSRNALIWLLPLALALVGGLVFLFLQRKAARAAAELSAEQRARIAQMLRADEQ
jgi:cytochrome c-type biogenesis protein CcmH